MSCMGCNLDEGILWGLISGRINKAGIYFELVLEDESFVASYEKGSISHYCVD